MTHLVVLSQLSFCGPVADLHSLNVIDIVNALARFVVTTADVECDFDERLGLKRRAGVR
jgi:hypothetical protein